MPSLWTVVGSLFLAPCVVVGLFTVIRRFKCPEKSWKHCLITVLVTPLRMLKMGPYKSGKLSMDKAIKYAVKKSKLTDFGGEDFIQRYNTIYESDSFKSQIMSNLGYISARIEMNMTWVGRLKLIQYFKDVPQLLDIPIRDPVFVMGLPRTGTTFLHRMLSLDPNVRAPLTWELLAPAPTPLGDASQDDHDKDRAKRAKYIKKLLATRASMGDNALAHIHEIEYDLPEECLLSLANEIPLLCTMLPAIYGEFEKFMAFDAFPAYTFHKKVLQLLLFQCGHRATDTKAPPRWVLKCPAHMFCVPALASAFPDAKLIWTHRHPVSAVPSLCSLLKGFHQVFYESDCRDDNKIGESVRNCTEVLLKKTPKDIAASGLDNADISYNSLVKDPMGTVKSVYEQFGWEFTPEYEKVLQAYLDQNRAEREAMKKKGGALHTYHPEEFGLTAQELCTGGFADYCTNYNIPMSKN